MKFRMMSLGILLLMTHVAPRSAAADMVFLSPGEDASSQVSISWHSDADDDLLEVTKADDPEYAKATQVSVQPVSPTKDKTFSDATFYRYRVTLDDLDSGSDYIVRVGKTSFTKDYHFRTSSGFGEFSFIHMSDVHAYPPIPNRVKRAEALVLQAQKKVEDIHFIAFTGDLTAWGAVYSHWEHLAKASFTSAFMTAACPGNHDYYNSSASTVDERFFNTIFYNPENGASATPNTTYWFRYHGAIFISLNSEARSTADVDSQRAWLKEVVQNNPAQYYIAYAHRGFFVGTGSSVRKTSTYNFYGDLLEELDVDLVLAGHEHVYVRTKPIQGGKVSSSGVGTVYITANQIGDRGLQATSTPGDFSAAIYGEGAQTSTISVITITDTGIQGVMFDEDGKEHDSYTIPARRDPLVDPFDPDDYVNSFSVHTNPEDLTLGILRFKAEGHERVRTIQLSDAEKSAESYASFTPIASQTQEYFGPLVPGQTYHLDLEVLLKNGKTKTGTFELVNRLDAGSYERLRVEEDKGAILLRWDNHLVKSQIDRIEVGVNETWLETLPGDASSTDITEGIRKGLNTITFEVVDRYDASIFEETLEYLYEQGASSSPDSPYAYPESEPGSGCAGCRCSRSQASPSLWFMGFTIMALYRRRRAFLQW